MRATFETIQRVEERREDVLREILCVVVAKAHAPRRPVERPGVRPHNLGERRLVTAAETFEERVAWFCDHPHTRHERV